MTDHDRLLTAAWDDFCDQLKAAGRIAFRPQAPGHAVDRTAAFRVLSRNIPLALAFHYENNNPLFPELMHYFDPTRKQGGDNTDAVYVGAQINGTDTYRVTGYRGTSRYFGITVVEKGDTPWGGAVASMMFGDQLQVEPDGSFELIVSPDPHPGNWLRSTPGTFRLTFRQFFADWENEKPMHARIDRISGVDAPAPQPDPAQFAQGLHDSVRWIHESINYWADMLEKWKARPNEFLSYRQLDDNKIDAAPGGEPLVSYWQLPKDEVLIVRVKPPRCQYWAVEFGNYWWETMDYRYTLSNTNCHYAQLEDDGELIVVVSHDDPGLPNWLDPAGFAEGYITFRWMRADTYPLPQCEQVKRSELMAKLPAGVKRIDAEQRREQLAARRRGVVNRFGA